MRTSLRADAPALRNSRILLWLAAAALVVAGSVVTGSTAHAATTINVTSTVDSSDGTAYACPATSGKPCTLRLAIAAANNDSGDTISIPAGTYTLTTKGSVQIRSAMTIVGADPRTTVVDGDSVDGSTGGIFRILGNPIDVNISNLTMRHGNCLCGTGGALFNQSTGTVTLTNDAFVDNATQADGGASRGGAVFNGTDGTAHLVVQRSLFARNQAIHNPNSTSEGGALYNSISSILSVTNSTITGNSADGGGGIFNTGVATLVNDTISGNTATLLTPQDPGGGGVVDELPSSVTMTNTIVSGNINGDCRKWHSVGTFTSQGHNIDSDGTCFLTGTGDKPNTNPKLAALALNAPGQTSTMAIDATSPAYNTAGASACPATDQRGVTRPQGTACDIGAYELVVAIASPSPSATPALPRAGESSGPTPGPGAGLVMLLAALLLAPLAIKMARRRYPDDIRPS